MWPNNSRDRKTPVPSETTRAEFSPAGAPEKKSIAGYIHRFANDRPGITTTFILGVISLIVTLLGNYNLLPCQQCFTKEDIPPLAMHPPPPLAPPLTPTHSVPQAPASPPAVADKSAPNATVTEASSQANDFARQARLTAMRLEAERWRKRVTPEYHNFLPAMRDINVNNDFANFNAEDWTDWNTLVAATDLLKWQSRGLTSETQDIVPIYININNSGTVADRLSIALKSKLRDRYALVGAQDAVLFIELSNADSYSNRDNDTSVWEGKTFFTITGIWIGGKLLFEHHYTETAKNPSEDEAIALSFRSAVKDAVGLINSPSKQ
jgi:hypothetical protein